MGVAVVDRSASCAVIAAGALLLGGCNAIFGIDSPEPTGTTTSDGGGGAGATTTTGGGGTGTGSTTTDGGGGAGTTTTSDGGGGTASTSSTTDTGERCGQYDGTVNVEWTDLGGSNIPSMEYVSGDSIYAHYSPPDDETYFEIGAYPEGFCVGGAILTLVGPPVAGQVYTLVDRDTRENIGVFHMGMNAYVETGARPANMEGSCEEPYAVSYEFTSTAGVGSVEILSLEGVDLTFEVTGVVTEPHPDHAGTGMLGIDMLGVAQCYWDGT